ncbi:MAG: transposase, partial [Caldilineaceae bacterium]|nr:transposase [Caldilineaceae bacterium]
MTATPHPTTDSTVIRSERYRVHFDSAQQAALCARVAGANRYVWNHMLADCIFHWRMWRAYKIGPQPSVSFVTLCRRFTALRNEPAHAWLRALPAAEVRYTLKYLADAYARYFAADKAAKARGETLPRRRSDGRPLTFPCFKSRHGRTPGFTIPDRVRLDGARLHIPKVGWVRLAGSGLYLGHTPKQVRVLKEGTEDHPKWYAHVFHEVPADGLKPRAVTGDVGVGCN